MELLERRLQLIRPRCCSFPGQLSLRVVSASPDERSRRNDEWLFSSSFYISLGSTLSQPRLVIPTYPTAYPRLCHSRVTPDTFQRHIQSARSLSFRPLLSMHHICLDRGHPRPIICAVRVGSGDSGGHVVCRGPALSGLRDVIGRRCRLPQRGKAATARTE